MSAPSNCVGRRSEWTRCPIGVGAAPVEVHIQWRSVPGRDSCSDSRSVRVLSSSFLRSARLAGSVGLQRISSSAARRMHHVAPAPRRRCCWPNTHGPMSVDGDVSDGGVPATSGRAWIVAVCCHCRRHLPSGSNSAAQIHVATEMSSSRSKSDKSRVSTRFAC